MLRDVHVHVLCCQVTNTILKQLAALPGHVYGDIMFTVPVFYTCRVYSWDVYMDLHAQRSKGIILPKDCMGPIHS